MVFGKPNFRGKEINALARRAIKVNARRRKLFPQIGSPQQKLEIEWMQGKKQLLAGLIEKLTSNGRLGPKGSLAIGLKEALQKEKGSKTILAIFEIYAISHPEQIIRKETLRDLAEAIGRKAEPILEKASEDITPDVRLEVVALSAELGLFRLVRKIAKSDPDDYVRKAASKALLV